MDNRLTAQIVFDKLGGTVFRLAVGAHTYTHPYNALRFWFEGCNKANACRIKLNDLGYYDIKFYKHRPLIADPEVIKTYENVNCHQLTDVFENFTGLCTSL